MPSIGLYVSRNALPPSEDDQLLAAAFEQRGAAVEVLVWDEPASGWNDVAVVCSTWDYTSRFAEFSDWLGVMDRQSQLFNPLPLLRRSLDKRYLLELALQGVPTVPSMLTGDETSSVREAAREQGWHEVVLKPLVSAGGRQVRRATVDALPVLPPTPEGQPEGWLVQPLLPGIADGEYSCVFVAGTLTHTVLKRPTGSEFRVQASYGGRTTVVVPPAKVRETAQRAVDALASGHVYARVDVVVDRVFGAVVMEVEMVEPDLFLRLAEDAAGLLADAVLARVDA